MAKICLFHSAQSVLVMVFLICSLNSLISSTISKFKDLALNKPELTGDNMKLVKTSTNPKQNGIKLVRASQRATLLVPICFPLIAARFLVRDSI